MNETVSKGTVHRLPSDIKQKLLSDKTVKSKWENLTPLARNEWICWATFVKQTETRQKHIERMIKELNAGKRRPCCWIGCIHRTDKEVSPSVKDMLARRTKNDRKTPKRAQNID